MQLDHHRIAIRQRDYLDILDLAVRLVRGHARPLAAALLIGVVPAICLNAWLLAGYAERDFLMDVPPEYIVALLLLTAWEAPLATAPITLYLGEAMFSQRPRLARIIRNGTEMLPQMLLYQVLLRPLLVAWPYLSEVILLERNPLRSSARGRVSTYRRGQRLHAGCLGELIKRWTASTAAGVALAGSLWSALWLAGGMLLNAWQWPGMFTVYLPLAVWIAVAYLAVARFLAYLDLRIRREGWEVELLMRAEREKLETADPRYGPSR